MGHPHPSVTSPSAPPIYQTTAFDVPDLDVLHALYEGKATGDVYTRDSNPNHTALAESIAIMEDAEAGAVFASGMGAAGSILSAAGFHPMSLILHKQNRWHDRHHRSANEKSSVDCGDRSPPRFHSWQRLKHLCAESDSLARATVVYSRAASFGQPGFRRRIEFHHGWIDESTCNFCTTEQCMYADVLRHHQWHAEISRGQLFSYYDDDASDNSDNLECQCGSVCSA